MDDTWPPLGAPPSAVEVVEDWRLHVLVQAGYPITLAEQIAASRNIDLHQAVGMLASGCPAELAAAILL